MQHIGIVACSAEGAALCYAQICRAASPVLGANDHPRITVDSIPLARWMPAFEGGDDRALAEIMLESAQLLATAGADFLICPDNSAHRAWSYVQAATPLPWLHIAEVVADEAVRLGARRVGVLGTRITMGGTVYPEALGARGIEAIAPEGDDLDIVDAVIFDELIHGVITDESRDRYVEVIRTLADRGCDAVALACTEIPLLVTPEVSPLPTLDSTRLLAVAALRRAISGSEHAGAAGLPSGA